MEIKAVPVEKPEVDINELFYRMRNCMDELSEARGVARCGLMYAMAQLVDALQGQVADLKQTHEEQLKKTEELYKSIAAADEEKIKALNQQIDELTEKADAAKAPDEED